MKDQAWLGLFLAFLSSCEPEPPIDDAGVFDDAGVIEDAGVACIPTAPVDVACSLDEGSCADRFDRMIQRVADTVAAVRQTCQTENDCTRMAIFYTCENGAELAGCPFALAIENECTLQNQIDQLGHEYCTACADGFCPEAERNPECIGFNIVCDALRRCALVR